MGLHEYINLQICDETIYVNNACISSLINCLNSYITISTTVLPFSDSKPGATALHHLNDEAAVPLPLFRTFGSSHFTGARLDIAVGHHLNW